MQVTSGATLNAGLEMDTNNLDSRKVPPLSHPTPPPISLPPSPWTNLEPDRPYHTPQLSAVVRESYVPLYQTPFCNPPPPSLYL